MKETILPSLDYISGIVETSGSFFFSKNHTSNTPVFQIKLVGSQKHILDLIVQKLNIKDNVHEYLHGGRHYAVLTIRKRPTIDNIIIPTFENRLIGIKKEQFCAWRDQFYRSQLSKLSNVSQQTNQY